MSKIKIGIILGLVAGIVDVIPMIFMKLSWDADLSAFSMWVVIGFLIAASNLRMNPILKGLLISFSVLLPLAIIIGRQNIFDLIPVTIMTLILGGFLGYFIGRIKEV